MIQKLVIMMLLLRFGQNPAFAKMCQKLRLAGNLLIVGMGLTRQILWLHCWWNVWLLRAGFVIRLSIRNTNLDTFTWASVFGTW